MSLLLPDLPVIGVDCETSGSDINSNHALIESGLAYFSEYSGLQVFSSLLAPSDDFVWSESAASVHNIDLADVLSAPKQSDVDGRCLNFLSSLHVSYGLPENNLIAVGFNVASFDFPFFAKFLPQTFSRFSYRAIDINSLCFLLHGTPYKNHPLSWVEWKDLSKKQSLMFLERNNIVGAEHRAGFDAALGLGCFFFLQSFVKSKVFKP